MKLMLTHYSSGPSRVACGRNNHDLNSTPQTEHVRCKKCRNSTIFKQRSWFDEFQKRTGTEPMGLDGWSTGASTFGIAAQYSLQCFLKDAEEMVQGLERDLQPLIADHE